MVIFNSLRDLHSSEAACPLPNIIILGGRTGEMMGGGHLCFSFPRSDLCLPLSCLPLGFDGRAGHGWRWRRRWCSFVNGHPVWEERPVLVSIQGSGLRAVFFPPPF